MGENATSLGVYLVHPLVTRAGSVLVGRFCAAPYGAGVVLLDWTLCWLVSFAAARLFSRRKS